MTEFKPMYADTRYLMADVAEILETEDGIRVSPNKWGGYDITSIITPDRHYVRILMDDNVATVYAFTRYGQVASTKMTGRNNAVLIAAIVLAYLDDVENNA